MSKNPNIIPLTRVTHTTANGDKVTRSFKTSTGRETRRIPRKFGL